jgi:hypothetical protein
VCPAIFVIFVPSWFADLEETKNVRIGGATFKAPGGVRGAFVGVVV